jgi:hypothetical protein
MELDLVPIARQPPESFYLNFAFPGPSGSSRAGYLFDFKSGRDRDRTDDLYRVKVVLARLSAQFGGCIETSSPIQ